MKLSSLIISHIKQENHLACFTDNNYAFVAKLRENYVLLQVLQNKHIPVERAEDAIETISEVLIHCQLFIKEQKVV